MENEMITKPAHEISFIDKVASRRKFLGYTGVAIASGTLLVSGCKKDDNNSGINLGSGDIGILNYAYALEQLEAAFYTKVISSFYTGITSAEQAILSDIQKHEVAHRDFFKAAIGSSAIPELTFNLTSINFTSRASVLAAAKAFEDLGVSAYNGAGKLIADVNYLLIAGKIVSVEARHAAAIRDLLNPNSADFAGDDTIDGNGLDVARLPMDVLAIAGTYITNQINASNLPAS